MIRRKYLMIGFLALASVTLGSLFFTVTQAQYNPRYNPVIESSIWDFVANFTLSEDGEPVSPHFLIQGERWRIRTGLGGTGISISGHTGYIIFNEDGYAIDFFYLGELLSENVYDYIYYVYSVPDSYYIELCNVGSDGLNFTIESYSPSGVGGFWIPVDKFSLLAPYIISAITIILAASISVAIIKHRKKQ